MLLRPPRSLPFAAAVLTAVLAVPGVAAASTLQVSTTGSDAAACTSAAPCRSISRAYQAASPGDTVVVAGGSYGGQNVPFDAAKTSSADVDVKAAPGASVSFGGLSVAGRHVTVSGIATGPVAVEKGSTGNGPSDVTVIDGRGTGVFVGGGTSDVSIIGGSYGQYENQAPVKVQGSPAPTRITFDGVDFHDAIRTDDSAHLECIYAADVQYFTVRNSTFRNCAIYDMVFTNLSGVNPAHLVIENNVFDTAGSHAGGISRGYYSLAFYQWVTALNDVLVRNNTFYQEIQWTAGNPTNIRATNNIFPSSACAPGVSYSHNVSTGKACGAGDKVVPGAMGQFASPGSYDFHLTSSAGAIDAADPSDAPSSDADGRSRGAGLAPDAGAYEYGSSGTMPGDSVAPDTAIGSAPADPTTATSAQLSFSGSDNTTSASSLSFECAVDGAAFAPCSSPRSLGGLAVGDHTFAVRAVDAAGNVDASPATRSWTVSAPATTPPVDEDPTPVPPAKPTSPVVQPAPPTSAPVVTTPPVATTPSAPQALTVALSAPGAGYRFADRLSATAVPKVRGASIVRVVFYYDGQRLAKAMKSPWRLIAYTVPGRRDGRAHTLTARALDSLGRVASVSVTVIRTAPSTSTLRATKSAAPFAATVASWTDADGGTSVGASSPSGRAVRVLLAPCSGAAGGRVSTTIGAARSSHVRAGRLCVVTIAAA